MPNVAVDGLNLYYEERGTGEPVALSHGIPTDYRAWSSQMDALSKPYRAISHSRPYAAPNRKEGDLTDSTVGNNAADLSGFIEKLGMGPVHLVGHSYGGSVAAFLAADEIWFWTDVVGILSTDPRIVPGARLIPAVSFPEALELSVLGVKALHPRAFEPAMAAGIPVRIRNCFHPEHGGTRIVRSQRVERGRVVKVVMPVWNLALVSVAGASMVGAPGTAAAVSRTLGEQRINILMISQSVSEANISVIIPRVARPRTVNALELALVGRGIVNEVTYEDNVCVVAAVGAGMKGTPGVAARLLGALARRGINVRMVAQGSSELNMSLVVREVDGKEAVHAIHEEFALAAR